MKVTPHTLIVNNAKVLPVSLHNERAIKRVVKAGGIILEDWETANKVAFDLTVDSGLTIKNPKFTRILFFKPHKLPSWAQDLSSTPDIAINNL